MAAPRCRPHAPAAPPAPAHARAVKEHGPLTGAGGGELDGQQILVRALRREARGPVDRGERAGQQQVVTVEEEQQFAPGEGRRTRRRSRARVGRGVVDDEQFEVRVALPEARLDALADITLDVVERDDDREAGHDNRL